jgi:hypothetical protein
MIKVYNTVYSLRRVKTYESGVLYNVVDLNAFGFWVFDPSDTTSPHDGLNIVVNNSGQRIKRQIFLLALLPPSLTATSGAFGDTVNLSWSPRPTSGGYNVQFSTDNTNWTGIGGTIAAGTTTYAHTGRTNGVLYYYRVKALAAAGYQESEWATASVTTTITLLLDTTNSAGAWSVTRKLRTAYSGAAFRVERASDNTQQDIGFSGLYVDESALSTFAAGTDAFVVTIYDQTGNSRNATVAALTNAPKIVNGGTLLKEGGKLVMEFDGTNDYFTVVDYALGTTFFIFAVAGKVSTNTVNTIYGRGTTNSGYSRDGMLYLDTATSLLNVQRVDGAGNIGMAGQSATLANMQLLSGSLVSANLKASVNAVESSNVFSTVTGSVDPQTSIGAVGDGAAIKYFFKGRMSEIVVYTTNQSSNVSAINTNINTHYTIY